MERKDKPRTERYYKCTARTGREAGLTIRADGALGWCEASDAALALYVSDDERLVAHRPLDAPEVTLHRAGRNVALLPDQRAILLHLDEITCGGYTFVVHKHGVADAVHPPRLVRLVQAAALAASLAVGGASAGCDEEAVRDFLRNVVQNHGEQEATDPGETPSADTGQVQPSDSAVDSDSMEVMVIPDTDTADTATEEIEIRDTPPIK